MVEKREVLKSEGKAFASLIGCQYFETSALTGENVVESFHHITREYLSVLKNPKSYFSNKAKNNQGITLLIGNGWFELLSTIYRVEIGDFKVPEINKNLKNVWMMIFSYVVRDERDKMNSRLVCKHWNDMISNHFGENLNEKTNTRRTQMKSIINDNCKLVATDWEMPIIYDNVSDVVVFVDATDINKKISYMSVFEKSLDYLKNSEKKCQLVLHNFENLKKKVESLEIENKNANEKDIRSIFSKYNPIVVQDLFSKKNISEVLSKAKIPNPISKNSSQIKKSPVLNDKKEEGYSNEIYSFCDSLKRNLEPNIIKILSGLNEEDMIEENKRLDKKFQKSQEIKNPVKSYLIEMYKIEDEKWVGKVMISNYNSFDLNCHIYCSQQIDVVKTKIVIKKEYSFDLKISYFGEKIEGSFIVLKFSKLFKKTAFVLKLKFN